MGFATPVVAEMKGRPEEWLAASALPGPAYGPARPRACSTSPPTACQRGTSPSVASQARGLPEAYQARGSSAAYQPRASIARGRRRVAGRSDARRRDRAPWSRSAGEPPRCSARSQPSLWTAQSTQLAQAAAPTPRLQAARRPVARVRDHALRMIAKPRLQKRRGKPRSQHTRERLGRRVIAARAGLPP